MLRMKSNRNVISSFPNHLTRAVRLMALSAMLAAATAPADERLFTYNYEADVLPKGGKEFEQWVTLKRQKQGRQFTRWDLREEFEYGLTDKLTTALYANMRQVHDSSKLRQNTFEFHGVSSEWKYQVLNPNDKPLGLLIYGEATGDDTFLELEEKVVLQKNFGEKWVSVFNGTVEQEWKAGEHELALELSAGLAYKLTPHWALGVEALNKRVFPEFASEKHSAYFVGPALHYGAAKWWATLTFLPQIAGRPATNGGRDLDEFNRFEIRLITGINF